MTDDLSYAVNVCSSHTKQRHTTKLVLKQGLPGSMKSCREGSYTVLAMSGRTASGSDQ